jgi:hypothetical protein
MGRRIHFLHHAPGRLRVAVEGLKGNRKLGDAIQGTLHEIEGIDGVQVNLLTGSVVLTYACRDAATVARLHALARQAESLLEALVAGRSPAAHALANEPERRGL